MPSNGKGSPPDTCEKCGKPGAIAQDLFPYLVEVGPPAVHRWMHPACAAPPPPQATLF